MIIFENHLTSPSYGWYSPIPHWAKADISMPAPGHTQLQGEWLFYHLVVVKKKKKAQKIITREKYGFVSWTHHLSLKKKKVL